MIKTITAISAAAFVAGLAVVLPGMAVSANTPEQPGVQQPAVKGDRLIVQAADAGCQPRAWPYYDRDCTFAARWQGETRAVRVVTTDRLAPTLR